jgi:hypothetical protein
LLALASLVATFLVQNSFHFDILPKRLSQFHTDSVFPPIHLFHSY